MELSKAVTGANIIFPHLLFHYVFTACTALTRIYKRHSPHSPTQGDGKQDECTRKGGLPSGG